MINPGVVPVAKPSDTSVNNFPALQNVQVQNFPANQPVNLTNEYVVTGSEDGAHKAIGATTDSAATNSTSAWSIVALLKGLYAKPSNFPATQQVSSADGGLFTVGAAGDTAATNSTSSWTVVSLLKGILLKLLGTLNVAVSNFPASFAVSNFPASTAVSNFPATQPVSGSVSVSNLPATQPVSGTVSVGNFPATQPVSNAGLNNLDVLLSTRLKPADTLAAVSSIINPVTEKKDVGRQQVLLSWEAVGGTTTEALTNFTNGSRGGVALAAASSYTVSAGKTLRIQTVIISLGQNGSSAANYRVRIRQAAAVTAASPVVFAAGGGGPSNTSGELVCVIPDGLEVAAGQQIAMTHLDSAAGGILSVAIIGFEY